MNYTNTTRLNILSKRAQNILERLGGVQKMLEFYSSGRSFMDLSHSGRKTELELKVFCENLIKSQNADSQQTYSNNTEKQVVENINDAMTHYFSNKKLLSNVTQKFLTKLEESFMISLNDSQKQLFIVTHFNPYFKFVRKSSFSDSLMRELNRLQRRMLSFTKFEGAIEVVHTVNTEPGHELQLSDNFKFNFLFSTALSSSDAEIFLTDDKYVFERLISAFLRTRKWSKKLKLIVRHFFFNEEMLSIKQVADLSDCSEQLVRTSITKLTNEIMPKTIEAILSEVEFEEFDLFHSDDKNWFIAEPFKKFNFNGELLTPNYRLGYHALKIFYRDKFSLLDELLYDVLEQNRTFGYEDGYLFVSEKYIEKVNLSGLIVFLECEIYEFESVRFDYNLQVLIERFYKENNILIEKTEVEKIYRFILKIKLSEISIAVGNLKRNEKKLLNAKISEIIEDYLTNSNQAKRTKELIAVLSESNINIDRAQLLLTLKGMPETFIRMGNGLCGLRKWSKSQNLQGSIREIVEHQLSNIDTPLHISEILTLLGNFRDVSKHSIVTNLKLTENRVFKFFNCAFIGLASKKYDSYWNNIPRFIPAKFMGVYRNNQLSEEMKIKKLIEFGYPEVHVRSVMNSKKNKEVKPLDANI
ncbi:MAG: hypothetical protein IPP77_10970 [Bacteroidetes bacterium]|nr:hypothetical protein [Bacteroidota bacterium]